MMRKKYSILCILMTLILIVCTVNVTCYTEEKRGQNYKKEIEEEKNISKSSRESIVRSEAWYSAVEADSPQDVSTDDRNAVLWFEYKAQRANLCYFRDIGRITNILADDWLRIVSYIHNSDGKKEVSLL